MDPVLALFQNPGDDRSIAVPPGLNGFVDAWTHPWGIGGSHGEGIYGDILWT